MVSRPDALQRILDLFANPAYLEVGVDSGRTFLSLKAAAKVGVDPHFNFDYLAEAQNDPSMSFHPMPSDAFFGEALAKGTKFDVIFLDGLHVFGQTLRDLLNAICILKPGGIIVVDDTIPQDYISSIAVPEDAMMMKAFLARNDPSLLGHGAWMGDVFKIPYFVASYLQQFSYATIEENHGQTVLWPAPRAADVLPGQSVSEIANMGFTDMVRREALLRVMPFETIMTEILASRA